MPVQTSARLLVAFALGSGVLVAARPHPEPAHAPPCAVTVEDSIFLGMDRTEVLAKYSEPIGDSLIVSFETNAKIDVISANRRPDNPPMSVTLVLDTRRTQTGKWKVAITGETGRCDGEAYVGRPKAKRS